MSEWISVKDKLPENDEYVLIYSKVSSAKIKVSWYSTHSKRWMNEVDVTHWQPLPSPPEGNQ